MRKLLLSFVLLIGCLVMANAKEYNFTMSETDATTSVASWKTDGFTFKTAKNNSTNDPTYNTNYGDVRIYAKGDITITAPEDVNILSISFAISTQGLKRLAPITASVGEIAAQAKGDKTVDWSGEANSIKFTVGEKAEYGSDGASKAGQFDFDAITIVTDEPDAAEPLYTFQSFASYYEVEGYPSYVPKAEATIEVHEGYVKILNWAGVEGFGMVVGFDEDDVVTYVTPITAGVEGEKVETGYVAVYTGLKAPEETYKYFYINEYCEAVVSYEPKDEYEEPGSGYVLLYGYDFNYEIEWPYDEEAAMEAFIALMNLGQELTDEITPEFEAAVENAGAFGDADLAGEIEDMLQEINDAIAEAIDYYMDYNYYYCSVDVASMIDEVKEMIDLYTAIAAYNADQAQMNKVINQVEQYNNDVEEQFPGFAVVKADKFAELTTMVEDLQKALTAGAEEIETTGKYTSIAPQITAVEEALAALMADQQTLIDEITAAYEDDEADAQELYTSLQELNNDVDENFPAYAEVNADKFAEVTTLVNGLNDALAAAMENAFATGVYTGIQAQLVEATEALMSLSAAETAAFDAINDAAMADKEKLQELYDQLSPIIDDEDGKYDDEVIMDGFMLAAPLYNYFDEVDAAADEAIKETAVYVSPLDADQLAALEAQIKAFVETAAISAIAADNAAVKYYDLNGVEVQNPANGKVYIRVANGNATKIVK